MKKLVFILFISLAFGGVIRSQCAANCTLYTVASIPLNMSPNAGTSLILGDDQVSGAVPIGFTFTFYCNAYTNLYVSSNGFLSFNPGVSNGCCSGQLCPSAGGNPNNYVAAFWNDLYPPGNGTIRYQTLGVAPNRIFVLTYSTIPFCCGPGPPNVSGQIKLYETSNTIEVHNGVVGNQGSNQTQGIMNATGSLGTPVAGRNSVAWTANNDAYRWTMSGGMSPPAAIFGPTSVCVGSPVIYSVTAAVGATSYNWTLPGGWVGASVTNTISGTPGASGTISVSITYTCGTTPVQTLSVTVNPLPIVSITGGTAVVCGGGTVSLTGNGASTYTWNPGALTGVNVIVSPTITTTYTVIGTSAAGCTASATKQVTVTAAPVLSIAGPTQICIGQTAPLTANGANTYSWSNGALTQNISVTPTITTTYSVYGTSTLTGCTSTLAITITVNPLPVISITGPSTLCAGQILNLTGNGGNTYTWGPGGQTTSTIAVTPTANITYSVIGTNTTTGCSSTAAQNITVNAVPTVTMTGPNSMCLNQTITLNGYGANSYSWSTGSTFSNVVVAPVVNTSYTLIGYSALLCPGLPIVKNVTVNPNPTVSIAPGNTLMCRGEILLITASGVNTYSWNNGALTPTISVNPTITTSYTVVGTNTLTGCQDTKTITISVSPCTGFAINSTIESQISVYPNPNNGEFTVELNNGLSKTIEVYDLMGRSILNKVSEDDKTYINISDLRDGIYYVKIQSNNAFKVVKIVIQ